MVGNARPESAVISLVIPVFNESRNLPQLFDKLSEVADRLEAPVELVFVDDGSSDTSWQTLQEMKTSCAHVKLIRFSRNFGKEAAIYAGLQCCRGRAAVVMDADLQHPPDLIPEMVELWRHQGVKVVHALKARRQAESPLRRLPALAFYWIMNVLSGYDLRGATDFKLLDRTVIDHYLALPETVRFFRGLIPWLGFNSRCIYFTPQNRQFGRSGWPAWSLIRMAVRAICAFSSIPMQVVTLLGGLTFLGALVLGIDTFYMKWSGRAVEGFTTVIVLLLAIGSVLMVSFGVIGQYLALIYEEIKARPSFIIERLEGIPRTETAAATNTTVPDQTETEDTSKP
jgi:glycosyltransferase involved in cell wall biosynthesis